MENFNKINNCTLYDTNFLETRVNLGDSIEGTPTQMFVWKLNSDKSLVQSYVFNGFLLTEGVYLDDPIFTFNSLEFYTFETNYSNSDTTYYFIDGIINVNVHLILGSTTQYTYRLTGENLRIELKSDVYVDRFYMVEEKTNKGESIYHLCKLGMKGNFPYIINYTEFVDLKNSTFFLSCTIPIRILNNYYIQLIPPRVDNIKQLPNKELEYVDIWTEIKVKLTGKPLLTTSGWLYDIDESLFTFETINNQNVYLDKTTSYPIIMSADGSANQIIIPDYTKFTNNPILTAYQSDMTDFFMLYIYDKIPIKSLQPNKKLGKMNI